MKVWVVMSGAYSDTSFEAVFSTRELAEEFVERGNKASSYPDYWVYDKEGHDLDEYVPNMRDGFRRFTVNMYRNGDSSIADVTDSLDGSGVICYFPHVLPHLKWPSYITVHARAKDEAHAVKIANEKRAQLIASGEWPADPE